MTTNTKIRYVKPSDLAALRKVVDDNNLFPSHLLDEMLTNYFGDEKSTDLWFTNEKGKPIAIAYCAPERMTKGTWNLYLIAVHPDFQSQGIGTLLVKHIEKILRDRGKRLLLVETSSLPDFEKTRAFYQKLGYQQEAQIREFYQAGEDKIIFRKLLSKTS